MNTAEAYDRIRLLSRKPERPPLPVDVPLYLLSPTDMDSAPGRVISLVYGQHRGAWIPCAVASVSVDLVADVGDSAA